MKTFLRISIKQVLFAGVIVAVASSIILLQENIVQGKGSTKSLVATTPLAGAKMFLTKVSGSSGQTSLTTISGSDGSFTFPAVTSGTRGNSMIAYTLTVAPAMTYTVTDSKSSGPKATPNRTPVKVSVTFNQLKGLTVGGATANTGPLGPFSFMSTDSLQIGVAFGGAISGTITKQ